MDVCSWCGSYLVYHSKEKEWYCNGCHAIPKDVPFDKAKILKRNTNRDLMRSGLYIALFGAIFAPMFLIIAYYLPDPLVTYLSSSAFTGMVLVLLFGLFLTGANFLLLKTAKMSYNKL